MRILLSGASGFIGAPLLSHLLAHDHTVVPLVRSSPMSANRIFWNPDLRLISPDQLEGFDAVIHLSGEPIASGLWTSARKKKILESRSESTQFLSYILSRLTHPPKMLLVASAVGYYGNRGEELLTEDSSCGNGFLSHVAIEWEKATLEARERGISVAHLRFGTVLSFHGGMLAKMIPFYRLGLGAQLGSGNQWMSWIALKDLISIIEFVLNHSLSGAINCVSPHPIRQIAFSKSLAKYLDRPHFLKCPASVLHFLLGSMGDELLLSSTRAIPKKLLETSFSFRYPHLNLIL
jgi:uncharacterized protein (TIGR01777 family)